MTSRTTAAPSVGHLDPAATLLGEVLVGRFDFHTAKIESVAIPATLDRRIGADLAAAVMSNGIGETIELRRAEFEEATLQRAREFGTAIPMPGNTPLVLELTVVQKRKEFDHEHIRSTRPRRSYMTGSVSG